MAVKPDSPRKSTEEEEPLLPPIETPDALQPTIGEKSWLLLVCLIFALIAFIDIGAYLADPPQTRIFEANLCYKYYLEQDPLVIGGDGTILEELCKVDIVQQRLASIFGWQEMFNALPGLLLAVPFGTLADRVGRKWVFVASLVGIVFSFAWTLLICYFKPLPLQLTWFSSAFMVIGGACILVAEMVAPIMAARLMKYGDWLPLLLALAFQIVGLIVSLFIPETLHLRNLEGPKNIETQSIELQPATSLFSVRSQLRNFRAIVQFLSGDWTLAIVVFTFLVSRLGRQSIALLVRYASKRYSWEIKKAAYLLSFRAAANLVSISIVLPLVNFVLLKKLHFPAPRADTWIACGSIALTTFSFFAMGVSVYPALLVLGLLAYNMGSGYNAAMRSISIHVIGGQSSPDIGKLMSTIAMAESLGSMIGGPLLNELFQLGIGFGDVWLGLPFLGSAVIFLSMTFVTFSINMKEKKPAYVENDEGEDSSYDEGRSSLSVR
ncbi:MFS general substrate transporter [Pyrenophora tritici-repentis]|nr:MFS general substrate transporter [Pyrenophora tritici-repentis]